MSAHGNAFYKDLFSSLVSDIKSYNGNDPLLPWIRGIKKMKETLPPQLLKQKLPRFLQRCTKTFLADHRYSNDLRYLRVWLQLMDFVDDPKEILATMEVNHVGMRTPLFYQAYALYYEKLKNFDAAERIYHLGIRNLAQPAEELQRSYEQFLQRKRQHDIKKLQVGKRNSVISNQESFKYNNERSSAEVQFVQTWNQDLSSQGHAELPKRDCLETKQCSEGARNTVNRMLQKPLEPSLTSKEHGDERVESKFELSREMLLEDSSKQVKSYDPNMPWTAPFEIYVDLADTNCGKGDDRKKPILAEKSSTAASSSQASSWVRPLHGALNFSKDMNTRKGSQARFGEDTVVCRFVGSTISEEQEVENIWHHGLIDPTVNLKEAMEDINSMFGKSIEFTRKTRRKKHDKSSDTQGRHEEFLILPDDESNDGKIEDRINGIVQKQHSNETKLDTGKQHEMMDEQSDFLVVPCHELDKQVHKSHTLEGSDLLEQTVHTKEALAEINKLFAMPVDF